MAQAKQFENLIKSFIYEIQNLANGKEEGQLFWKWVCGPGAMLISAPSDVLCKGKVQNKKFQKKTNKC